MGLLNPALLALAAAVAVPLLLHLLQRHQGPRVVFPALRYLRRAETEHARRIRLRQLLLMLLRVAVLVLIAGAAARPYLRAAGAAHQPTAVVIVLDNSMSTSVVMRDRRVLDELKDRALVTLDDAETEDLFWLMRAGSPWEPAWPGDPTLTARRVRETVSSSAAADLIAALDRARAILATGAQGRATEIQLLTDMQATNLVGGVESRDWPTIITWTGLEPPPDNVAIEAVEVGGGVTPIAGQRSTVAVLVTGRSTADSVNVRLTVDDRVIAATTTLTGAASILSLPAGEIGFLRGWVEKDPDAVRPDDRRYFATRVAPPPAYSVSGTLGLVDEALAVLERAGRIRSADPPVADAALLPGARGIDAAEPAQSVIVLPPDSAIELPAVNRRIAAAGVPWQFETGPDRGDAQLDMGAGEAAALRALETVRITVAYRLIPQQGAASDSVLLRLTDGSPWAVRGTRAGGGRYVVFASPFSTDASTLPTSTALVPLLDRLFGAWIAGRPVVTEAVPGQEIGLPERADAVRSPDGTIEPATGTIRLTGDAGVYTILHGDSTVGMVAVNPPALESDLRRADLRRLHDALPGAEIIGADRADEWRARIFRERVGREIWRFLVLATVALLAIEALVAAAGATSRRTTR